MILDQLFCYCSFEDGKKTSDMVKFIRKVSDSEQIKRAVLR